MKLSCKYTIKIKETENGEVAEISTYNRSVATVPLGKTPDGPVDGLVFLLFLLGIPAVSKANTANLDGRTFTLEQEI